MSRRKSVKLILKEGSFKLGYIDLDEKRLIELWNHNGFNYKLIKKSKIESKFTDHKEIAGIINIWLENINLIYRESKLNQDLNQVLKNIEVVQNV